MNASDQRRLTPLLGIACVLAAAFVVVTLLGVGASVQWGPGTAAAPGAAPVGAGSSAPRTPSSPLDAYAAVWQRPLFNESRQPVASSSGDNGQRVNLGDLQLTGIILTPGLHMALMHDRTADRDIRVREGAAVPGGNWVLHALKPRQAVFVDGGKRVTLELKVPQGQAGGNGGKPAVQAGSVQQAPPTRMHPHAGSSRAALSMRPPRASPASSSARTDAQRDSARMQKIKARIKQLRRQQREQRNNDAKSSHP